MNSYIAITALGADKPNIINQFTQSISSCGGNILNIRMTSLGNEFAVMLLIEGSWGAIAKIESSLPGIEKKLGLVTNIRRTNQRDARDQSITYLINAITLDRGAIISDLAQFFASHDINIQDINADTYQTNSGMRMMSLTIHVNISVNMHIPTLRDKFMLYCDALNLDAGMEPLRD